MVWTRLKQLAVPLYFPWRLPRPKSSAAAGKKLRLERLGFRLQIVIVTTNQCG